MHNLPPHVPPHRYKYCLFHQLHSSSSFLHSSSSFHAGYEPNASAINRRLSSARRCSASSSPLNTQQIADIGEFAAGVPSSPRMSHKSIAARRRPIMHSDNDRVTSPGHIISKTKLETLFSTFPLQHGINPCVFLLVNLPPPPDFMLSSASCTVGG